MTLFGDRKAKAFRQSPHTDLQATLMTVRCEDVQPSSQRQQLATITQGIGLTTSERARKEAEAPRIEIDHRTVRVRETQQPKNEILNS